MQKRKMAVLSILLLMVMCVNMACFQLPEPGPEFTLLRFQDAYNDQDYDAMLECIEPTSAKAVRAILKLTGDFIGIGSGIWVG